MNTEILLQKYYVSPLTESGILVISKSDFYIVYGLHKFSIS